MEAELALQRDANGKDSDWVENRPATGWLPRIDLRELWAYRELGLSLARRDLQLRYRQTFFGVAWAVLQPLVGVAIFTVVFDRFVGVPSDGVPYPVFVYAGLVIWTLCATGVERASNSLVEEAELVTKVYFPRLIAPAAAVLPGLVDLAVSLVILASFLIVYDVTPDAAVVTLPLWIGAGVLVAAGAGFWLAALNVRYRDVKHTLTFLLQVWFFASPVIYASSALDGAWRFVFALNPMVGVIDGFRWSLAGGPAPQVEDFVSLLAGMLLLVSGTLYFQRFERRFADII
jgi:lipopolysaccharide transport system permease protein